MIYKIIWKKEAEQEFDALDHSIKKLAISQFKKLQKSPQLGLPLGNKMGMDLSGYRKLYFFKKKYRIIYSLDEAGKKVKIFAVGQREDMAVYKEVLKRLESK